MNKECRRCHTVRPAGDFGKSKVNKDGLQSYCRSCMNEYAKARYAAKERTDEERARARVYSRNYRYGVTGEKYQAMLNEQNNACAVCKVPFTESVKPNVDHDHKCCPGILTCGKCVRGLLCGGCTAFAGMIETRFSTHEDMFRYLHLHHNSRWGTINLTERNQINT